MTLAYGARGRSPAGVSMIVSTRSRIRLRASSGVRTCSLRAPSRDRTAATTVETAASVARSSPQCSTTSLASCHCAASPSTRAPGSIPIRSTWSPTREAAYELYVAIVGRTRSSTPWAAVPGSTRSRWRSRTVTRSRSSPAALRVNVRPRTWSGSTRPLATRYTTRAAIVSVFPEPAPATTRTGSSGASMIACCSAVGWCGCRSSLEISTALNRVTGRPARRRPARGSCAAPGRSGTGR